MNAVQLIGRLTRNVDLRYSDNGNATGRFTLAVDRRFKREGEQNTDFINCVTFGKTAEFVAKYFGKGNKLAGIGRIQTGSYQNRDGKTVYTTDVILDSVEFCESAKGDTAPTAAPTHAQTDADGFMNVPDYIDEELPFN